MTKERKEALAVFISGELNAHPSLTVEGYNFPASTEPYDYQRMKLFAYLEEIETVMTYMKKFTHCHSIASKESCLCIRSSKRNRWNRTIAARRGHLRMQNRRISDPSGYRA